MGLVDEERKESGSKEQYDLLWSRIVEKDETERQAIIEKMNFLLLPRHQKINFHLKKFKTPLLWIVPLCSISIVLLLYVVFILAALWTE